MESYVSLIKSDITHKKRRKEKSPCVEKVFQNLTATKPDQHGTCPVKTK